MQWGNYIARTTVRAIVFRVVGVMFVLALAGIGVARASDAHPTEGEAYAHCQTVLGEKLAAARIGHSTWFENDADCDTWSNGALHGWIEAGSNAHMYGSTKVLDRITSEVHGYTTACVAPAVPTVEGTCEDPNAPKCSASDPPLGNLMQVYSDENNSAFESCSGQCGYVTDKQGVNGVYPFTTVKIDGVEYVEVKGWIPSGEVCTASNEPTVPPVDSDGDGVSDGKDGAPDNAGSDGDHPTAPPTPDPDCGTEGNAPCPDKTDPNDHTSTGGADCQSPPRSSGDPILAQIAFQTWATRCAVLNKANERSVGDVVKGPGNNPGDSNGNGVADVLEGTVGDSPNAPPGVEDDDGTAAWGQVDQAGWLGTSSCPGLPDLELNGMVVSLSEKPCDFGLLLRALLMTAALASAAYIIGAAAAGQG